MDLSGDDTATLLYMGLLGFVLVLAFAAAWRGSAAKLVYNLAIWVAAFGGLVVAYNWYQEQAVPRQAVIAEGDGGSIEVPVRRDGHYHLTLEIDGVPVEFVVDTGASNLVLTMQDAERIGIDPTELRFFGRAMTANGEVRTADVRLDEVRLGGLVDRNVPAVVNGGEMPGSLMGMSYLGSFGRIEIADGVLRLTR
ncbi:TIGR02281 family clan AA aspartic protease [Jannaschia sp. Os4]|uniref:retropepsin-like aspartic protease family protein n=1 Tax=Jannaschia sp. Os4 TaxID=2807617 RepID=UPI00193A9043|nr:TIGR02281 family clan AA aspartic protease [Jannaschia sp. Os4]MBM2577494.1 TIGR02281 family clan AA aspartic protease [Jannaschia sp. Os4]